MLTKIRALMIGFATTFKHYYELAVFSKNDFIWDKEDLLVPAATNPVEAAGRA